MPIFQLCFYFIFTYNMSFHKEYYLINVLAKFSIYTWKLGYYKLLFFISEINQHLKSIYNLRNKKAVKCINVNISMFLFKLVSSLSSLFFTPWLM